MIARKRNFTLGCALIAGLLAMAMDESAEAAAQCKFVYTAEVRHKVTPLVKEAAGPRFHEYDLSAPIIDSDYREGQVLLTFHRKSTKRAPFVSLIFAPCEKRFVPYGPVE